MTSVCPLEKKLFGKQNISHNKVFSTRNGTPHQESIKFFHKGGGELTVRSKCNTTKKHQHETEPKTPFSSMLVVKQDSAYQF
jgi:hypothetical protein